MAPTSSGNKPPMCVSTLEAQVKAVVMTIVANGVTSSSRKSSLDGGSDWVWGSLSTEVVVVVVVVVQQHLILLWC